MIFKGSHSLRQPGCPLCRCRYAETCFIWSTKKREGKPPPNILIYSKEIECHVGISDSSVEGTRLGIWRGSFVCGPSHNKREGPGEIGVFNDWLCLVHNFSLHKTLNDTLKNHEARNIEEGNVMLWPTSELASYLHNGCSISSKECKFQLGSSRILWLDKVV